MLFLKKTFRTLFSAHCALTEGPSARRLVRIYNPPYLLHGGERARGMRCVWGDQQGLKWRGESTREPVLSGCGIDCVNDLECVRDCGGSGFPAAGGIYAALRQGSRLEKVDKKSALNSIIIF